MKSNKVICLYTQPRTGSCFLMKCFETDASYISLEEVFSQVNIWGITKMTSCVSDLVRINYEQGKISQNKNLIPFFKSLIGYLENGVFEASVCDQLILMFKENFKKKILFKVFHHHIERSKVNEKKFFSKEGPINTLILNYRKNNLLRWISEKKAYKTNNWIKFDKRESGLIRIVWNKNDYINDFKKKESDYKKMLENYKNFLGEKKIICYENIHKEKNVIEKIQEIVGENLKINPNKKNLPIKQSNDCSLADNFINKEEFLKDLEEIKNNIYIETFENEK